MPFGLGFFATAGGAAIAAGDYDLLTTSVIGTATGSISFDLTPYSSTYKHLQIRYAARSSRAAEDCEIGFRFNNDSGSNYVRHDLDNWAGGVRSSAYTSQTWMQGYLMSGANSSANIFGAGVVDFLDVFATKNKTIRGYSTNGPSQGFLWQKFESGLWINTNTPTTLSLHDTSGNNFVVNSRFSLYGLKG